jgi:glycosyl-4,4'-diaponeurosporenoate acyltransferase
MAERWIRLVALDAAVWVILSIGVGYGGHRLSDRRLQHESAITRPRAFEQNGDFWQHHFAVRRWKDRLPEAGAIFGGMSKRHLRHWKDMGRLAIETRRAELVHWSLMACGPLFLFWNPPALGFAMILFAVAANGPCIVIQRFNRYRLLRLLARKSKVQS